MEFEKKEEIMEFEKKEEIMEFEKVESGNFKARCGKCKKLLAKGKKIIVKGEAVLCNIISCPKCGEEQPVPIIKKSEYLAKEKRSLVAIFGMKSDESFVPLNKYDLFK